MKKNSKLKVSIIMGSQSDYKVMKLAEKTLKKIGVSFETKIISAHRTPQRMYEYAAKVEKNNIGVIIAGAGGSAHLPGMVSAHLHMCQYLVFLLKVKNLKVWIVCYQLHKCLKEFL